MLAEIKRATDSINVARAALAQATAGASHDAWQIEITRRLLCALKLCEGLQYVMIEVTRAVEQYEEMRREEFDPGAGPLRRKRNA